MSQSLKALLLLGLLALTALAVDQASPVVAQAPPRAVGHQTFQCTQTSPSFFVPAGVTRLGVVAEGAQGGSASHTGTGGRGGLIMATLEVTPGQQLYVYVGCSGQHGS